MKLRLNKSQRVERCDTEKAFAIKYGGNQLVFLSKKYTTIDESIIEKNGVYWSTEYNVEFPDWMFKQMQWSNQQSIKLIKKQWQH